MNINVFGSLYVSRILLTELLQVSDEYDDLSDLKPSEMEQVKEWELQFRFQQIPLNPQHLKTTHLLICLSHPYQLFNFLHFIAISDDFKYSPFSEKYELVGRLLKPGEEVKSFSFKNLHLLMHN